MATYLWFVQRATDLAAHNAVNYRYQESVSRRVAKVSNRPAAKKMIRAKPARIFLPNVKNKPSAGFHHNYCIVARAE